MQRLQMVDRKSLLLLFRYLADHGEQSSGCTMLHNNNKFFTIIVATVAQESANAQRLQALLDQLSDLYCLTELDLSGLPCGPMIPPTIAELAFLAHLPQLRCARCDRASAAGCGKHLLLKVRNTCLDCFAHNRSVSRCHAPSCG